MIVLQYYRSVFFIILFFFIAPATFSQDVCGCKEAEQLRAPMGMYFNSGKLDSATFYTQKLLTYKELGCNIFYQDWMAQIALGKKDYSGAKKYLDDEKKLLKEYTCGPELYVRHYSTLAKYYQELNFFDSLIATCLKGVEASQTANDFYGLSRANADMAAAFAQLDQNDKAIFYYNRSMDAAKKQIKVPSLIASIQTRLSNIYLSEFRKTGKDNYADSVAILAKASLEISSKYHDLITYLEANEALANHALLTADYSSALQFSDVIVGASPRGVHLFDRLTYAGFSKKSEAYYKLNEYAKAEQFADSAFIYAEAFNPQMMVGAYENIYLASKANNNDAKALIAHEQITLLRDSLFGIEKNSVVTELEKKYDQAKNEKTIKELAQQKRIYLLLVLAGLLALLGSIFFIRQQSLKNKQKILEAEQRLNRARMNPHFFFNTLSSLQALTLEGSDWKVMAKNLSKFSHIMRETLESTYKEYITIEQETVFLNKYLELQKMRFPQKFTYAIMSGDDVEIDEVFIPSMILQPFVENSIEHGFSGIDYPGHISVDFNKEDQQLKIIIIDNGKGLKSNTIKTNEHISRASQIIKDRIYLLNIKLKTKASFTIDNNENEKGVTVLITLPLLYKKDITA